MKRADLAVVATVVSIDVFYNDYGIPSDSVNLVVDEIIVARGKPLLQSGDTFVLIYDTGIPDGPGYPHFRTNETAILSLVNRDGEWIVAGNRLGKFSITGSTVENSGIPVGCFASRIATLFNGEIESLGLSDDFFRRTRFNEPEDAYTSGCLSATAYPNPFGSSTTIRFRVSTQAIVRLRLYDILGRELHTLVDEPHEEGTYETRLDGRSLAAGVYVYRLEVGGEHLAGQVVLVK